MANLFDNIQYIYNILFVSNKNDMTNLSDNMFDIYILQIYCTIYLQYIFANVIQICFQYKLFYIANILNNIFAIYYLFQ